MLVFRAIKQTMGEDDLAAESFNAIFGHIADQAEKLTLPRLNTDICFDSEQACASKRKRTETIKQGSRAVPRPATVYDGCDIRSNQANF
jgi:hypothetical protein